jgi:phosphoribosylformylglycinamidine synthase subunit PurL
MALSTDGNGHWCAIDPRAGTALIVAESALNLACVGARPVALVNCLNFGNPEHPEVMWQLSEAIDGMSEACRALDIPVIGGNVSLYNESRGRDIDPTPVVGTLGLVDRLERRPAGVRLQAGQRILLLGPSAVSLGGSRWAVQQRAHRNGRLAPLDLDLHARLLRLVAGLAARDDLGGVHDVADGGIAVALAEMAMHSGVGFVVTLPQVAPGHVELFGEGPSRVLLCAPADVATEIAAAAATEGIDCAEIGTAGGDRLVVSQMVDLDLEEATARWRGVLPEALGA